MTADRVAVVGGGIAGLTCAGELERAGLQVEVFDSGRAPAGRAATHRGDGAEIDHGAPCFQVTDPTFAAAVERWRGPGVVAAWAPRTVALDSGHVVPVRGDDERLVGVPSMSSIARHLAGGLTVHPGRTVRELLRTEAGWYLDMAEEQAGPYRRVVVATAASQAVALLRPAQELAWYATQVRTFPIWVVAVAFAAPVPVAFDLAYAYQAQLTVAVRNSSKPRRGAHEAWALHASTGWTQGHVGLEPARVVEVLCGELASVANEPLPEITYSFAHRWSAALPQNPLGVGSLWDPDLGLGACGDWCRGNLVEDAYLSGMHLAQRVIDG